MSNLSKTFKAGELVILAGRYVCLTCKYAGTSTEIDLRKDALFPMCKVEADSTWQLLRRAAGA